MKDYTGCKVFIGIDVHKNSYSVTAVRDQEAIKKSTIPPSSEALVEFCKKYFKGAIIQTAYEAGFCGFSLHRSLEEQGVQNKVVHPASIEIAARERVKTDRRDSQKIAVQLSVGRLNSIFIPDQRREDFRLISRIRETLAKEKARKGNQIKSLLYQLGKMPINKASKVSASWIKSVLQMELSPEQRLCLEILTGQWLELQAQISRLKKKFEEQAKDDKGLEEIYRSAPGVGPIAARTLVNELGDMKHFSNERALFSYTGLTPREYSSGDHRRLGHISQQGKPILRRMLVQAAWVAIKHDENLKEIYEKIRLKAGGKKAIIAIARRLVGRIRACINKKCSYQIEKSSSPTT
jgi:transposase